MTKDSFGEHLKREREMRGVSLDEISAATRIATRFLRAIENEQWELLPGGVFNRGFVRAVAHYLGLDEESIMAEFGLAAGQRPSVPVWTGSPPAVRADKPWLAWALAAIAAIALIAGGWFVTRLILSWRAAHHATTSSAATVETSPATAPITSPIIPPVIPSGSLPSTGTAPSSASAEPSAEPSTQLSKDPTSTSGITDAPATPGVTAAPAAAARAATNPDGNLVLKIESAKTTKVTVETDSHRVFEGTIKSGQVHRFTARNTIQVSARDAGALLLELNGQTLAPIGPTGHKGKITLTRATLKGAPGGAN